jgi:hypothetical protein
MCNKMAKNYTKFIEDMMSCDNLLNFLHLECSTIAFKDVNGTVSSPTTFSAGQSCPPTHKVMLQIGPRRHDREATVVEMTAEEYNDSIRSRMTTLAQPPYRSMAWRNYLIDNNLLPKLLGLAKHAAETGIIYKSKANGLAEAISRFVPNNHERKVA